MTEKQHYFLRLVPPRPTFPFDMSDGERALMEAHVTYIRAEFDAGRVLAYGPVLDAGHPYGMGILAVDDEAEARAICDQDPTVVAGLNRYELSPMRLGGIQG
jgi:uncharacterized protein YciI